MRKFLISGILTGIVITIVSTIMNAIISTIWPYNLLSLEGIRSVADPVMILYFLYPWVLGFALVYAYNYIERALKGNYITKGKKFGMLTWIVVSIPSAFLVWSSMNYPIGFTINSVIGSLIYMIATGITIAWVQKK